MTDTEADVLRAENERLRERLAAMSASIDWLLPMAQDNGRTLMDYRESVCTALVELRAEMVDHREEWDGQTIRGEWNTAIDYLDATIARLGLGAEGK